MSIGKMGIPNRQGTFSCLNAIHVEAKLRYVKLEGEVKAQKTCTAPQMLLQIITPVKNGRQHEHGTEDGLGRLSLSAPFTRGYLLGI
jgi:hypothetical protein